MGIIKDKLNQQIENKNKNIYSDTTGTILSYDAVTNTAKISFRNPNDGGVMVRESVPVTTQSGGMTTSGITAGMQCNIAFYGSSVYSPVITGVNGSLYNDKTCSDQGGYLVSEEAKSVDEPDEITPMSEQWLDEDNDNENKYNGDLGEYQDTDVSNETNDILMSLNKYTDNEQGITNLSTKSTVKLKENGDIDLFVSNNIGIRISPSTHGIYLYGDFYINDTYMGTDSFVSTSDQTVTGIANTVTTVTDNTTEDTTELNDNIQTLIATNNDYMTEVQEVTEVLVEITGTNEPYTEIYDTINEYKSIVASYDESMTAKQLNDIITQLNAINDRFKSELDDIQNMYKQFGGVI